MKRAPSLVIAVLVLFVLVGQALPARAQQTAPADLDQIVQQAQTIVWGRVLSVRTEPHPQFPSLSTVVVTLQADRVLKGRAEQELTFRQYIFGIRDSGKNSGYGKAEELLLFLNPVSQYGLTSPVGLEQGRFRIERDAQGNAFAMNGRGNVGLFNQVVTKAEARGTRLSARAVAMMTAPAGDKVSLEMLEETVLALMERPR